VELASGTVTLDGTESALLDDSSDTTAPPDGAFLERFTVQTAVPCGERLPGVQLREGMVPCDRRSNVVDCD
jgi:hypothetical protein